MLVAVLKGNKPVPKTRAIKIANPTEVRFATWERQLAAGWAGGIRTHGMTESKSVALPLGDSPVWRTRSLINIKLRVPSCGVEDGIRTHGLQSHNLAL